ncbi:Fc.00g053190.m01.CDS01 [Cosmosporella sp. VM-42]
MSTTTTQTPTTQDFLHDYDIHLTGREDISHRNEPQDAPRPEVVNPPDWPDHYRQTPPYRPINRGIDQSQRPWGSDRVESGVVMAMFGGVWIQSVSLSKYRAAKGCADIIVLDGFSALEED